MKNSRSEYLPAMDTAVVGVASGEDLLRWLTELKNTDELGAAVQAPAKLRQTPAHRKKKLDGGARGRFETGGIVRLECKVRIFIGVG
jgi:hypothetical protein